MRLWAVLRLQDIQLLATHNSYHVEPDGNTVPDWAYTHAPLDVQLGEQGVRGVELDTNYDPDTGVPEVYHVPTLDAESTCSPLADCLGVMRAWSDAHPGHHTLFVHLEPKDAEFGRTFDFGPYVDAVEESILAAFPRDRVITPDDVQGDAATLREAVTTRGWPTLAEGRGKIVFYLNETALFSEALTRGGSSLSGRLIFPEVPAESPLAAILIVNDPAEDIEALVRQGFLVRTRADSVTETAPEPRRARGLASGAQIVTTDFPVPSGGTSAFVIPDGAPSRCNPVTAPAEVHDRSGRASRSRLRA